MFKFKRHWAVGVQVFNHWVLWSYEVEKPMFKGEMSARVIRFGCFSMFVKWMPAIEVAKKVIAVGPPKPGFRGHRG